MDIQGMKDSGKFISKKALCHTHRLNCEEVRQGLGEDLFTRVDLTASKYEMIEE